MTKTRVSCPRIIFLLLQKRQRLAVNREIKAFLEIPADSMMKETASKPLIVNSVFKRKLPLKSLKKDSVI